MSVTVPKYEAQVQPGVAVVPKATFATPNPESFGTGVAKAMTEAGATVKATAEQLANHAIERLNQQREMDVYKGEMNLREKMNQLMFSNNDTTIKDANGNDRQIKEGAMNNLRDNAVGMHQYFADNFTKASTDFINSQPTDESRRLAAYLSQRMYGYGSERVSNHEMQENKAAVIDNSNKAINSDIMLAPATSNPKEVSYLMDHASQQATIAMDHQGLKGTSLHKDSVDEARAKVLEANLGGLITGDPSGNSARAMFDMVGKDLSQANKDKLSNYITSGVKKQQAEIKQQNTQSLVDTRIGVFNNLTKMDWRNASSLISTLAPRDKALADAVQKVVNGGNKGFKAYTEGDKDKQDMLNTLVKNKDSLGLTNTMIEDISAHPNMKPSELAIYIQAGINMHKALPTAPDFDAVSNPKQEKINSGIKSIIDFGNKHDTQSLPLVGNYIKDIDSGISPDEAYENAMQAHAIEQYPEAATMSQPPNYVIDKDSPIRVIFPRRNKNASGSSNNLSK